MICNQEVKERHIKDYIKVSNEIFEDFEDQVIADCEIEEEYEDYSKDPNEKTLVELLKDHFQR